MPSAGMCDDREKVVRFELVGNSASSLQAAPTLSSTDLSHESTDTMRRSNRTTTPPMTVEREMVRDYDTNVTKLYQLLESSDWEGAVKRCRTHPREVQTWVVRRQKRDKSRVRWKLLPLHSAVIFSSPDFVVAALLDQYRDAVTETDDQGMTPLHLAFRHYQDEDDSLISLLLEAHPECITCKDYRGRSPIDLAMKRNKTYSARLMNQYASACIEITLKAQDAINQAVNGARRCGSSHNDNRVVDSSRLDQSPDDERAEMEKDEIAHLEQHEQVVKVQQKPIESAKPSQAGYEVDEIEQLEREERERGDEMVAVANDERDGSVVETNGEQCKAINTPSQHAEDGIDDKSDERSHGQSDSHTCMDECMPGTRIAVSPNLALKDASSNNMTDALEKNRTDKRIQKLQDKHEREVTTLRTFYEERIQTMADQTSKSLQKLFDDMRIANRELKEQHYQDIQRIKQHLTTKEGKKCEECRLLQHEVDQLRATLNEETASKDACRDEMMNELQTLQQDHLTLQTLLLNQQKELDTTQQIRALMLKSIWQQDTEEGETRKMEADGIAVLADRIHARFERLLPGTSSNEVAVGASVAVERVTENVEERQGPEEWRSSEHGDDDDLSSITDHSSQAHFDRLLLEVNTNQVNATHSPESLDNANVESAQREQVEGQESQGDDDEDTTSSSTSEQSSLTMSIG